MTEYCDICRGSRVIRLPVYKMVEPVADYKAETALEISSREYPCPECSPGLVPFERLGLIKQAKDGTERLVGNEQFLHSMRRSMAQEIGMGMLGRGYMRFEQDEPDSRGIFRLRATVGVVAPQHVAKFEERVRERQFELADEVIEVAAAEIDNWGSHYGMRTVAKCDAIRWLGDALNKMRRKHAGK